MRHRTVGRKLRYRTRALARSINAKRLSSFISPEDGIRTPVILYDGLAEFIGGSNALGHRSSRHGTLVTRDCIVDIE